MAENIPLQTKQSSSTKFSRKELKLQNYILIIYLKLLQRAFTNSISNKEGWVEKRSFQSIRSDAPRNQPISVILVTGLNEEKHCIQSWGAYFVSLSLPSEQCLMENHQKSAIEFQEDASREYCVELKTTFTLRYFQNR